jgi:hypothetical protein
VRTAPLWYVARPLRCALAAPTASLRRTTCRAMSIVRCCAPPLRLCPLCDLASPLGCVACPLLCPRCAYVHSACTTSCGPALVRCSPSLRLRPLWTVPSLRLCPLCAYHQPAVVRRSSFTVRPRRAQVSSLRCTACRGMSLVCWACARSALYHLLWSVARPLRCALAAPMPTLRRTSSRGMSLARCCASSLRLCPLCAYHQL